MTAITTAGDSSSPGRDAVSSQLAELSHELPTTLDSVIGLSTILARQVHGPLTDKPAEFVAQVGASGGSMLAVVASILDLANVPQAYQGTSFESFEQVDSSLPRRQAGTGIGLSLSRRLTELEGGSLKVRSMVGIGIGSRLTATFPHSPSYGRQVGRQTRVMT